MTFTMTDIYSSYTSEESCSKIQCPGAPVCRDSMQSLSVLQCIFFSNAFFIACI